MLAADIDLIGKKMTFIMNLLGDWQDETDIWEIIVCVVEKNS